MRIGVISDIHVDINRGYDIYGALTEAVREQQAEGLIIAGDISENSDEVLAFMERLNRDGIRSWFVPGNHDMWDLGGALAGGDTWKVWEKYCASPFCLGGRGPEHDAELPGGWVLIGDIGWYDYSLASAKFTAEELSVKSFGGRTWMDSYNAHWGMTDRELDEKMRSMLEARIAARTAEGKKIILVTHMLTHPYFKVLRPGMWEYFNAFLGSSAYAELCMKYGVKMSLMGHVHHRQELADQGVRYICACLGYHSEWKTDDCRKETADALRVFEI